MNTGRPRFITGEREKLAAKLYDQNLSDTDVAVCLDCSKSTVAMWRTRTGRKPNFEKSKRPYDDIVECVRAVADGRSASMTMRRSAALEILALLDGGAS